MNTKWSDLLHFICVFIYVLLYFSVNSFYISVNFKL